jgi:hypothetical protein
MQQQLAVLCSLLGSKDAPASPAAVVPTLLWQPGLLLPEVTEDSSTVPFNSQQQQQGQQGSEWQEAGSSPLQLLQHQLQELPHALQLPTSLVQHAVLATPELLQLAGSNDATAVAAVETLSCSWLCAGGAATRRQQHQQQLLQLLRCPEQQQRQGRTKRKQSQQLQAPTQEDQLQQGRYIAADALDRAALSCQWWSSSSSSNSFSSPEVQQLPALQQLVVQAPALLVLAAVPGSAVDHQPAEAAAAAAAGATGLSMRLQGLCQQLLDVLQADRQQQQQQAPGSSIAASRWPKRQQQQQQQQLTPSSRISYGELLEQLQATAVLEPCLLSQSPAFVASQLMQLSKLLALHPFGLWQLLLQCPAVLWLTEAQVYNRIRVLSGVLKMPAVQLKDRLTAPGALQVLLMDSSTVRRQGKLLLGQQPVQINTLQQLQQRPQGLLPGWRELAIVESLKR